ncbi:glycosyltransferase [Myroides odoratimimus]|uniref:glycosyltransferase n=1 Tax=Myroides odoratimimus TaxID=76832 RepID=UPI002574F7FC|nr:glycosyltransferase [Myroides odoratimimus]MDM1496785.1 glycosyltransferase [Myroides odoratimimus]MDM1530439.1 glycosyltransferase [Myroides odoratimimus]
MKVAHIVPNLNTGGAEKLIVDSLSIYNLKNIDTELIVLQEVNNIFSKTIKGNIMYISEKSPYNLIYIFELTKLLKRYDLVHVHLFPTLYWVVLAKILSFSKVKIVYTEHNTSNRRRNSFFFKICDRFIYSRLDYIGCISKACYKNLVQHLNYKKESIGIIENGIDLNVYKKNVDVIDNKLFDTEDFVLIQVSSFREQKDQKTLIKAMSLLPKEIKLLLVGDGHLRKECEELAKQLKVFDRIKFLGNRIDIPQLFKSSDLAIQSSNYEGFGLVSVEAMASGRAIIASDVEGLSDVVRGYGVLFTKGNSKELVDEILKFYNDKSYKEEIECKCKKRANDFDINNMVEKYISIYQSVI